MTRTRTIAAAVALLCGGLLANSAQALGVLDFSIERLSNTQMTITARAWAQGESDDVFLLGLISPGADAVVAITGANTMKISSSTVTGAAQLADGSLRLDFSQIFPSSSTSSGSVTLTIAKGILADLGGSGSYSFSEGGSSEGDWSVASGVSIADSPSSVPLPPALALLAAGVGGFGLIGRTRRRG